MTDPAIQLVVIATTHDALAPIASKAVSNGQHVLIEKPGGRDLDGVAQVAALAREHGVEVRVGYNHRFHPSMLAAKELVESGRYGPILHIRARYGHGGRIGYESEWRAKRDVSGGGELVDQGSHLIDLTRHFCGDVSLAFSELRTEYLGDGGRGQRLRRPALGQRRICLAPRELVGVEESVLVRDHARATRRSRSPASGGPMDQND